METMKEHFTEKPVKISVRNLIAFILRSGDIDNQHSGMRDSGAMQEGSRLHRKLQKSMKGNYSSEVPLSITLPIIREHCSFSLTIEGRADGIITAEPGQNPFLPDPFGHSYLEHDTSGLLAENGVQLSFTELLDIKTEPDQSTAANTVYTEQEVTSQAFDHSAGFWKKAEFAHTPQQLPYIVIDEIKGVYRRLSALYRPVPMHRYQALCYAYIYAKQNHLPAIGVQMTYCHLISEEIRRFHEMVCIEDLETWFLKLAEEYANWMEWQFLWRRKRDASLKGMPFPFPYRCGQQAFAEGVYSTIYHKKKLYLQAPTGTGKTMSTLYPAAMSLGTGLSERVFYLTAKTITRTVAEEATQILLNKGACLKTITITAKEKLCPQRKFLESQSFLHHRPPCNPIQCSRAKGHFDRINDAVFALLHADAAIERNVLLDFAQRFEVCPFEMALDTAIWCDIIICDYNYLFDPNIYLKRFFSNDKPAPYVFLIDEAHNLVERAREMYSAQLFQDEFSLAFSFTNGRIKNLSEKLLLCDHAFMRLRNECSGFTVLPDIQQLMLPFMQMYDQLESFLQDQLYFEHRDNLLTLYFHMRHFFHIYDICTKKFRFYADCDEQDRFYIMLRCMDPSDNIQNCLMRGSSSVLFSATLLPMPYYQEQLAGTKEDYAMLLPSPFAKEHFRVLIAREVSTRFQMRIEGEFQKIVAYILAFFDSQKGNYIVFFPSYQMLETIASYIETMRPEIFCLYQRQGMEEKEREQFLLHFTENPQNPVLALCTMGGIFSEGIDLKRTRLIGTVIVGPGLPMVCEERELYKRYFEENQKNGFDYAYLFPGMNKVLQAAGRVIRTEEDRGLILLLDDRFLTNSYRCLFPAEWEPEPVTIDTITKQAKAFWEKL